MSRLLVASSRVARLGFYARFVGVPFSICDGLRSKGRAWQESKPRVAPIRAVEEHLETAKASPIEPAEPTEQNVLDDSLNLSVAAVDYLPLDDAPEEVEHCHRDSVEWQPPASLAGLDDAVMILRQPYRLGGGFPSHVAAPNMAFDWESLSSADLDDMQPAPSSMGTFELDRSIEICEVPEGAE